MANPSLDLDKYHFSQAHGDLCAIGTWIYDEDDATWVPALVIAPAHDILSHERVKPCAVMLDSIWAWSEEAGGGYERQQAAKLKEFCDNLRIPDSPKNCIRILSIIRDHIEDVLRIPPRPPVEQKVVADVLMVTSDGKERHTEIREDV